MITQRRLPVLYSFRRCPYAMRARLAIAQSGTSVEIREILLREKPKAMLAASPKGTVPVLVLTDDRVIEESLDIMFWALRQNDPDDWLANEKIALELIMENDSTFKFALDRYKYAQRYPENPPEHYRSQGEVFLHKLEQLLRKHRYLLGAKISMADIALLPFVRQFAQVDKEWFSQAGYPFLQKWLDGFLESELFQSIMQKYEPWRPESPSVLFPER